MSRREEDNDPNENKFLLPVRKIILSHFGLLWRDIYAIHENKYKSLNLYKLRYYANRGEDEKKARIIENINRMLILIEKKGLY